MITSSAFITFLKGYGISTSLVIAIGAQNAFVLKQGITRSHTFIVALLCSIIDAIMIVIAVNGPGGGGLAIISNPYFLAIAKYGGALFLFFYGLKSFYLARHIIKIKARNIADASQLSSTIITLLMVSFLNPHIYLDTVVLLGLIANDIAAHEKIYFTFGAILASFIWFFTLIYGSGYLSPLFSNPMSWRILDFFIGITAWSIAISLLWT